MDCFHLQRKYSPVSVTVSDSTVTDENTSQVSQLQSNIPRNKGKFNLKLNTHASEAVMAVKALYEANALMGLASCC